MSEHFHILDENPNDTTGGGGCLCSELKGPDTKGPFIVFNSTELDTLCSPFPVVCAGCALAAVKKLPAGCEPLPEPKRKAKPADDDLPRV